MHIPLYILYNGGVDAHPFIYIRKGKEMKKLLLIDGNSILNRSYFAMYGRNMLQTEEGIFTNAIFGFLNTYEKFQKSEEPTHIMVAFDMKYPTFRHEKFKDYKAGRKQMPDELAMQMPLMKEILDDMGIKRMEIKGYEADDIIGTMAKKALAQDFSVVVITGDRDMIQLAGDKCDIKIPTTAKGSPTVNEYNRDSVLKDYGIEPGLFIEVKALMGDKSDNIPGVRGIGEKTALSLIAEYGNLENLYQHIDDIKSESIRNKLLEDRENAFLSRELGRIFIDCPVELEPDELEPGNLNEEGLLEIFKKLEFNSFIKKYKLDDSKAKKVEIIVHAADDFPVLKEAVVYCRMDDKGNPAEAAFTADGINVYILTDGQRILEEVSKLESVKGHYLKGLFLSLLSHGLEPPKPAFDTAAAAYLVDALKDTYGVDELADKYLRMDFSEDNGIAARASKIHFLEIHMKEMIKELGMKDLLEEVELPLMEVLASMEFLGFRADRDFLDNFQKEIEIDIDRLEKEIYEETGTKFNINSPAQLGKILFEDMNLPYGKKKKNGFSTNAEILEKLAPDYRIASLILEFRKLSKLRSTYTTGLVKAIAGDGRIHSNFRQTVTATGRLSSTEPNLQNLPVRTEIGRNIRRAFIPENKDYLLTSADYSQIELRVLAHVSDDSEMKAAFKGNIDIHTMTAAKVFGVDDRFVTKDMRRAAKAVNFGIIYGISDFSLAGDINVSVPTAREYINEYLNQYPGIRNYMTSIVEFAVKNGYVKTIFGRRRYIPELESKNYNLREFGKRVALNAPIQGAAADIIKKAMNDVYYKIKKSKLKSRLILQVHDELVVETHKDEIETIEALLRESMEGAVELSVPLTVDIRTGNSLYETK